MQIKEYLNYVCEQIKYKPAREDISKELQSHIEDIKNCYIEDGVEESVAEENAIKQMGDAKIVGKKLNKIHRPKLDWKLIVIVFILLSFGFLVASIRSKANMPTNPEDGIGVKAFSMQSFIKFVSCGLILSVFVYFIDYKKIIKYSGYLYFIAVFICIFSILFGGTINGKVYFPVPLIYSNIAPSIIVVPLYIVAFVGFITNIEKKSFIQQKLKIEEYIKINKYKIPVLAIISVIMLVLVNSLTFAIMLAISYLIITTVYILYNTENLNKTKKIIKIAEIWGSSLIISLLVLIYIGAFSDFRIDRVKASFNPELDPQNNGYLGMQSKMILNSANLFGKSSTLSPAMNVFDEGTNYALVSIVAYYGWIVAGIMVIAIIGMCTKLIVDSIKIKDITGKLLIIGISVIFILKSVCNILMNVNFGITADFNIPFVSYSGGSLIVNMICMAVILGVYRRKNISYVKNID